MIVIFLIFRGLTSLVSVNDCNPKAIPHVVQAPYGSEAYANVLFKAYAYKIVQYTLKLNA